MMRVPIVMNNFVNACERGATQKNRKIVSARVVVK